MVVCDVRKFCPSHGGARLFPVRFLELTYCSNCSPPHYSAKFVTGSVALLRSKPGGGAAWLRALRDVPYADAVEALCTLPGVGPKVRLRCPQPSPGLPVPVLMRRNAV